MKKAFLFTFALLLTYSYLLVATIIEAPNFKDLNNYVTPNTLVILDIDDTLLIPTQSLGTDVWFRHRWNQYKVAGESASDALEKALAEWEGIRQLTQVKIVEEGTAAIIKNLQDKQITVMGLTTQGLALATCTIHNLASLDIILAKTAPSKDDYYFMNGEGVLYRQGILFTSGTVKGVALVNYLDHINYRPKRIVFINDKATHLRDVEEVVTGRNIEFIGLRYAYSDERVNAFKPEIADIQWNHSSFNHILTDAEAEELLCEQVKNK